MGPSEEFITDAAIALFVEKGHRVRTNEFGPGSAPTRLRPDVAWTARGLATASAGPGRQHRDPVVIAQPQCLARG